MDHYVLVIKTDERPQNLRQVHDMEKSIRDALQQSVSAGEFNTRPDIGSFLKGFMGSTDSYYEIPGQGVVRVSKIDSQTGFAMEVYLLGFAPQDDVCQNWKTRLVALGFREEKVVGMKEIYDSLMEELKRKQVDE